MAKLMQACQFHSAAASQTMNASADRLERTTLPVIIDQQGRLLGHSAQRQLVLPIGQIVFQAPVHQDRYRQLSLPQRLATVDG